MYASRVHCALIIYREAKLSNISDSAYTVLIIDDDPDLLPMLAATLRVLTRFTVHTANDGAKGLELFHATRPDCVVVDVKLPSLDGFQFARAVRGDPHSQSTPIIMLTALALEKDRYTGYISGTDYYLVKPIDPPDLVAAIRRAIALSEQERYTRQQHLAETPTPIDVFEQS